MLRGHMPYSHRACVCVCVQPRGAQRPCASGVLKRSPGFAKTTAAVRFEVRLCAPPSLGSLQRLCALGVPEHTPEFGKPAVAVCLGHA